MKGPKDIPRKTDAASEARVKELEEQVEKLFASGEDEVILVMGLGDSEAAFEKVAENAHDAGWIVDFKGARLTISRP